MFKNQSSCAKGVRHTKLWRAHRRLFSSWVELNYQPLVRTSKSSAMRPSQPLHQSRKSSILKWLRWGINTCRQANSFRKTLSGFEQPISCLQDRRINHYATEPQISHYNDKKLLPVTDRLTNISTLHNTSDSGNARNSKFR